MVAVKAVPAVAVAGAVSAKLAAAAGLTATVLLAWAVPEGGAMREAVTVTDWLPAVSSGALFAKVGDPPSPATKVESAGSPAPAAGLVEKAGGPRAGGSVRLCV